jgi:hypothetical protein
MVKVPPRAGRYGRHTEAAAEQFQGTRGTRRKFRWTLAGTAPAHTWPADFPRRSTVAGQPLTASAFQSPGVALSGVVDYGMYISFRNQFNNAASQDFVVFELATLGGDPEVARMMGEDIRFASEMSPQRRFVFLARPRSIRPARPS